jgi:hypothetical protein
MFRWIFRINRSATSGVAAGAEGVAPLAIREEGQQVSGPSHVVGCDAMLKELLRRTPVCELDEAAPHTGDEPALLVAFRATARGVARPLSPSAAARSRTTYQCSTWSSIETR